MTMTPQVRAGRVYDEPTGQDGSRVLVDRVWPRGRRKDELRLDEWCKQIAPSTELRTWYHHAPELFDEFTRRYTAELDDPEPAAALAHLKDLAGHSTLTLLTATKNPDISEAAVLSAILTRGLAGK